MKTKFFYAPLIAVFILMITGCNKAPQTEIDAAFMALKDAQSEEAELYLPEEYSGIKDSLDATILQIEGKKAKWFAGYKNEKAKLDDLKVQAIDLRNNVELKKEEIRNEVQQEVVLLKQLIDENKRLLSEAPKGKEGTAVLIAMKDEIGMHEGQVNDINNLLSTGELRQAQNKVIAALDHARSLNSELKEAIAKYQKRGGK